MALKVGIRLEDKNHWERRVPVTPEDVGKLLTGGIDVTVQSSPLRIYPDEQFSEVGARVSDDLDDADLIIAVKEIPKELIAQGKAYIFFSHTIKGQDYNMPLLRTLMDRGATLMDYERVVDENNVRLIAFGRFAGIAGMVETLWGLGRRLDFLGQANPFSVIKHAYEYSGLAELKDHIRDVGTTIRGSGLPAGLEPFVVGITGYGNVARGAQEILDLLPMEDIEPSRLAGFVEAGNHSRHSLYRVVFREEDMVIPAGDWPFVLSDYYQHPERYTGIFQDHLQYLSLLMNCTYWDERYPRHVTRAGLKDLCCGEVCSKLLGIGDVSCDIGGGVEATTMVTEPDQPVFMYDPMTDSTTMGVEGNGVFIQAVDNLPTELPRDASETFSEALTPFIPGIVAADWSVPFADIDLPAPIKRATILYKGELTPEFEYMRQYID